MTKNKFIPIIIIIVLVIGAAAFYQGMKYAESNKPQDGLSGMNFENFRSLSAEERQAMIEQSGMGRSGQRDHFASNNDGAQALAGEIIAQNEDNVVIKLRDGSTSIIFLTGDLTITKSATGTAEDLKQGEQIFISGKQNPDGSYTADTIRLSESPINF